MAQAVQDAAAGSLAALRRVQVEEERLNKQREDAAKELRAAPEAEARQRAVSGQVELGSARQRAEYAASPRGQAYLRGEEARKGQQSLAQMTQELARMRAESAHLATPAGRAQLGEEAELAREQKKVA